MSAAPPHWSSQTKIVVSLLMLGLLIFLLYRFREVVPPFVLSLILAYVLSPGVNRLQARLRLPRSVAILLAYLLTVSILALIVWLVVPPLAGQLSGLNLDIQRIFVQLETLLGSPLVLPGGVVVDGAQVFEQLNFALQTAVEPLFGRTLEFLVDIVSSLVWLVFVLVVGFYLIKDWPALREWFDRSLPPAYRQDVIRIREEMNKIWSAFFRGQLLLALVVALIFTVMGLILGLPFAFAMGVLAGLLEFLPSVGHGIWLATASLLSLVLGSTWLNVPNWIFMAIVIGLHLVFQQFDLNYLIPRIIGRSVQLPPLVVILGIVSGAVLAGVLGIVLAAPTIASARILGRYIFAKLFDMDPFTGELTAPLPPPDPDWWRLRARAE